MKKKDVELVFKGADEKSWQELLDDLRPTGRWIDNSGIVQKARCSKCNKTTVTEPFGEPDYCPNCGADMRGCRE